MIGLRINWLAKAVAERRAQLLYITATSPRAAIEQGDLIEASVDRLVDFPELGRPGRRRGTRELVIIGTPFVAIYRIHSKAAEVQILRLLHGAQRWPPRPSKT